jgi:uncharacterized lipoprotein YmbA
MTRRTPRYVAATLAPLLALSGCALLAGPKVDPTNYFVLNAVAPATGVTSDVSIGLGPVEIPAYLDRPQMARRVDQYQIAYSETALWAEPLAELVPRTMAADLVLLLGPRRLELFPWYRTTKLDFVITVAFSRFEEQPDGSMALGGRWTLRDKHRGNKLVRTFANSRVPGPSEDRAAVLSALLADLTQEIATAIQAD